MSFKFSKQTDQIEDKKPLDHTAGQFAWISFDNNNKKILIAKVQNKIYATDGICTHEYADLSTGFLNEQEKTVTCPLHLSNPPAELPLKTYNVKIEDNGLLILIDRS